MTYRQTKWNRIRPILMAPFLPLAILACGLYGFVLRPFGRGARTAWQDAAENFRTERRDFRENLRFLWEGYVWAFTGRDLTTPRLEQKREQERKAFYEGKLGRRAKR